jgi:hypothetical protein
MAITEEEYVRAGWAKDLSDEEYQALKGRRYLLQRPGNSTLNWTATLAARPDMKEIDGLQNMELYRTGGIALLGIFAGKNGKPRDNPNAQEDALFYKTDQERVEMEAAQAEKYAQELRKRADDGKKLQELDVVRETLVSRPEAPDYGSFNIQQLVTWARDNCDGLKIRMPMKKAEIIETIEEYIRG